MYIKKITTSSIYVAFVCLFISGLIIFRFDTFHWKEQFILFLIFLFPLINRPQIDYSILIKTIIFLILIPLIFAYLNGGIYKNPAYGDYFIAVIFFTCIYQIIFNSNERVFNAAVISVTILSIIHIFFYIYCLYHSIDMARNYWFYFTHQKFSFPVAINSQIVFYLPVLCLAIEKKKKIASLIIMLSFLISFNRASMLLFILLVMSVFYFRHLGINAKSIVIYVLFLLASAIIVIYLYQENTRAYLFISAVDIFFHSFKNMFLGYSGNIYDQVFDKYKDHIELVYVDLMLKYGMIGGLSIIYFLIEKSKHAFKKGGIKLLLFYLAFLTLVGSNPFIWNINGMTIYALILYYIRGRMRDV